MIRKLFVSLLASLAVLGLAIFALAVSHLKQDQLLQLRKKEKLMNP